MSDEINEWVTGNIKFTMMGEPVEMQMTVPAKPVKLRQMLPIFYAMSNQFVEVGETAVKAENKEISCQKGCGACCRQPVPIAESEAYYLADLVENLPEPRRSEIKQKFAAGVKKFTKIGWLDKLKDLSKMSLKEKQDWAMEYFHQGVPCPFLAEESCSIHLERPTICREYLVTSPAENCKAPTAENIEKVTVPLKVSESVRIIMGENRFVPLIAALDWVKQNPKDEIEKTGQEWMGEFFKNLTGSNPNDSPLM